MEESEKKNHGKCLEQRRNRLAVMNDDYAKVESKHEKIKEGIDGLGPAGERADRDFRKQEIMTLRTLLLENTLIAFMSVLMGLVAGSLSMNLDSLIKLLFERSGCLFETPSELVLFDHMLRLRLREPDSLKLIEPRKQKFFKQYPAYPAMHTHHLCGSWRITNDRTDVFVLSTLRGTM